jgi:hypothetical protein
MEKEDYLIIFTAFAIIFGIISVLFGIGTLNSLDKKLTGHSVSDSGTINLSILSSVSLNFTVEGVNWKGYFSFSFCISKYFGSC